LAQLREVKSLPDLSHFKIVQGRLDISATQVWPSGAIEMVALLYKVCFRVEQISGEPKEYICQNITPGHTVEAVWGHLIRESPDLRGEFNINQTGLTHSGQVIVAEIQKTKVWQNVCFQVFQKRWIRYERIEIWNVWTPEEGWHHSAQEDERILPIEAYEVQDRRPWEPYGSIEFTLKPGDVPDTTENGCGSAGGDGRYWPLPRVDPVPPGHEHGEGQLEDGEQSSGTDSEEDIEGSDDHKLAKIKHAIEGTKQPVQVILNRRYA
jgi:hypothetical protein